MNTRSIPSLARRERERAETRGKILEAARRMFVQKDPFPLAYLALSSAFDAQSDLTNLSPTFPFNSSFWTNQQFLDLYNQLISTSNPQERQQLSFQLQKIVHDDPPYAFLWLQFHWYGVNKKLNWTPRPDEYLYFQHASFNP